MASLTPSQSRFPTSFLFGFALIAAAWGSPWKYAWQPWTAVGLTALLAVLWSLRSEIRNVGRVLGVLLLVCIMLTWVLAFTPTPFVWATLPGFVGLLILIETARSTRQAILWICIFGALGIGFGYRWLSQTVMDFGGLPEKAALATTALFGLIGTVHGWLFAAIYRSLVKIARRPHPLVVVCLFVAVETLPLRLFAWMAGHGAIDHPALRQSAEWGGVPAVSFALLCLVAPFHEWLRWIFDRDGSRARPTAALLTFVIGAGLWGWGAWRYEDVKQDEIDAKNSVRVGIVQPNHGSRAKREAERMRRQRRQDGMTRYAEGSRKAFEDGAELIVWPETAITDAVPFSKATRKGREPDWVRANSVLNAGGWGVLQELGSKGAAFLVGVYEQIPPKDGRKRYTGKRFDERYNTAALRDPGGRDAGWQVYRKEYLIPFGEAMPFGIAEDRLPQNFKMRPAPEQEGPLTWKGLTLVPFLCYEGILAEHVLDVTQGKRPDILVSLTNDSWFGDTWEPHQHLNFTRFRAIEHRAPLVRSTNTGISAFVSATGDVADEDRLGLYVNDAMVRSVPLVERGRTVYAAVGHFFPYLLYAIVLMALIQRLLAPPAYDRTEQRN